MRARVEDFTLPGSLKYFETVGREIPIAAANSSMFRIFLSCIVKSLSTPNPAIRIGALYPSLPDEDGENKPAAQIYLPTLGKLVYTRQDLRRIRQVLAIR